jgi:NitT/TauT family transport system permease protein
VGWVILAMIVVILLYDQFLFRPLVAWADKFRMETPPPRRAPQSWVLNLIQRTRVVQRILRPITRMVSRLGNRRFNFARGAQGNAHGQCGKVQVIDWVWGALIAALTAYALCHIVRYVGTEVTLGEVGHVVVLGLITLLRVVG